jgi:hypothetical protein
MPPTPRVRVVGVLQSGHKGPAVEVPFDPATEWNVQEVALFPGRRGYPVEALLRRVRFKSAIVSRMRRFFVLVDGRVARKAGAVVGHPVQITVWPSAEAPTAKPRGA